MEVVLVIVGIGVVIAFSKAAIKLHHIAKALYYISHVFYVALPIEKRQEVDKRTKQWRGK